MAGAALCCIDTWLSPADTRCPLFPGPSPLGPHQPPATTTPPWSTGAACSSLVSCRSCPPAKPQAHVLCLASLFLSTPWPNLLGLELSASDWAGRWLPLSTRGREWGSC